MLLALTHRHERTSELGPIVSQVTMVDGQGNRTTVRQAIWCIHDYRKSRDENDFAARLHFIHWSLSHWFTSAPKERATRSLKRH